MPTWNPAPENELEQKLLEVGEIALQSAAECGASSAEVTIGQDQGLSVTVRNGDVETIEHNRDKSLGITVYFGNHSGSASTTDFSGEAIQSSATSACNIAKYTEEDDYNGLADEQFLATSFPDLDLHHPWSIELDEAIDIASQCEHAALSGDHRITNSEGATLSSHDGVDLYANSIGFRGFSRSSRHSTSCAVVAGRDDEMQRDYWYDSRRCAAELASPAEIGEETVRRTVRRLGARKLKTGEYPVIFEPNLASSLLSHLVTAASGTSLYRKASFLVDRKGESIFPDTIQIYEQPHLKRGAGSAAFDNEGVATRENWIVRNGVLENYVLNSYAARKLGMTTTGNAGGIHNLVIDSTMDGGLDEMVAELKEGLIVSELIGFGVNTLTGDYSRGAFGFWVENGEIRYPVEELTIAGNLKDMFMGFVAVGNDVDERKNIRSGSIMIDNLTVAGL
jgi:PmbA protein